MVVNVSVAGTGDVTVVTILMLVCVVPDTVTVTTDESFSWDNVLECGIKPRTEEGPPINIIIIIIIQLIIYLDKPEYYMVHNSEIADQHH